jgi:uncharacterized membrane protein YdbT with pleckstrin-like domain
MSYAARVLKPGETIVYEARIHGIVYLGGVVLVMAAVVCAVAAVVMNSEALRLGLMGAAVIALLFGLAQILRAWIKVAGTEITVTSQRVIYKIGILSRSTVEMNLDKVESVLVQQSLVGRMLDFGTVIVRGVGAGLEPVNLVAAPLELHRHIGAPAAS